MQIEELGRKASLTLLTKLRLARLACAKDLQPYITPIHYAYHDGYVYSFSTVGQKIEWMRANPRVCLEADEIKSPQEWSSVIVFGRYEELPNTEEWRLLREMAYSLLQQREIWWEPGLAKTIIDGTARPLLPLFYRVFVEQITGHRASVELIGAGQ
jgi:uncharacterized protein